MRRARASVCVSGSKAAAVNVRPARYEHIIYRSYLERYFKIPVLLYCYKPDVIRILRNTATSCWNQCLHSASRKSTEAFPGAILSSKTYNLVRE